MTAAAERETQAGDNHAGRFDGSTGPRIVGPHDGKAVDLGSLGVRFMIWGAESGGGFSLVEHPLPPHTLAAPLHRHAREDEYSYVLEGRLGAQLGDDVVYAGAGDLVFKPRQQWHTFWNAGDEPCLILEIISPAGFEHFFDEVATAMEQMHTDNPGPVLMTTDLPARFAIEFRPESVPELCTMHGLRFPGMPEAGPSGTREAVDRRLAESISPPYFLPRWLDQLDGTVSIATTLVPRGSRRCRSAASAPVKVV